MDLDLSDNVTQYLNYHGGNGNKTDLEEMS